MDAYAIVRAVHKSVLVARAKEVVENDLTSSLTVEGLSTADGTCKVGGREGRGERGEVGGEEGV